MLTPVLIFSRILTSLLISHMKALPDDLLLTGHLSFCKEI